MILVAPGYLGGYVSGVPWQEEEENESEDDRYCDGVHFGGPVPRRDACRQGRLLMLLPMLMCLRYRYRYR